MNSRWALLALVLATTLVPVAAMGMASSELYGTKAYTYGRFEARIRFAPGDGVISSFFLWKEGSEVTDAYWNELDFEKVGADCHMQTNAIFGNPSKQHSQTNAMPGDTCAEYHDYRFEWTPTYIAWNVDGKEIRRDSGDTATAFSQNASGGMTFHFNVWPGNANFGGNISNATLPVREYISWVQYSSYDNSNFNLQWREEFQASSVPSGWAVGNWGSPYNLSTHSAQNVGFVSGVAVLSLTADGATGNPGTPPADNGSGESGGTGGASSSSGGATSTGGQSTGGIPGAGGSTSSSTTGSGGTLVSGGSMGSGGATGTGGTTTTGGTANGGSAGPVPAQGGCSCSTVPEANRSWPALVVLFLVVSRLRRRSHIQPS